MTTPRSELYDMTILQLRDYIVTYCPETMHILPAFKARRETWIAYAVRVHDAVTLRSCMFNNACARVAAKSDGGAYSSTVAMSAAPYAFTNAGRPTIWVPHDLMQAVQNEQFDVMVLPSIDMLYSMPLGTLKNAGDNLSSVLVDYRRRTPRRDDMLQTIAAVYVSRTSHEAI